MSVPEELTSELDLEIYDAHAIRQCVANRPMASVVLKDRIAIIAVSGGLDATTVMRDLLNEVLVTTVLRRPT